MKLDNSEKELCIEKRCDNFFFRFGNSFNQRAMDFEDKFIRAKPPLSVKTLDDDEKEQEVSWPRLSHWQSYRYIKTHSLPYYFLQMSNLSTNEHYQLVAQVETSAIPLFKIARAEKWVPNMQSEAKEDQLILIKEFIAQLKKYSVTMKLNIGLYLPGKVAIDNFTTVALNLGFKSTQLRSYPKTRFLDLRPEVSYIKRSFSANGRSRLNRLEKNKDNIDIKILTNTACVPALKIALNSSYQRSIQRDIKFDFLPLLKSASQYTDQILLLGFFIKNTDNMPKAFVTGVNHGSILEYSIGGSIDGTELRKHPFNHHLLWELALIAKDKGCHFLDLGGISSGANDDPLKRISSFKRLFPGFELSVGQELERPLRSTILFFYFCLKKIQKWTSLNTGY